MITHPLYEVANELTLGEHAPAGFWHQVDTHHRAILRAVTVGDAPAARGAARAHLEHIRGAPAWHCGSSSAPHLRDLDYLPLP